MNPEEPAREVESRLCEPALWAEAGTQPASCRFSPTPKRLEAASTSPSAPDFFRAFDREETISNLSGNLPHWRQAGTTYFITFRTADSLPHEKLLQWEQERIAWLRAHPEPHTESDRRDYFERFPQRLQHWLDQGYGECVLSQTPLRLIVENALRFFNGQRYQLLESVVMPNHVHALITPLNQHDLSEILHSWKSFTATKINQHLKRTGPFWQKESFDHIVRTADSLEAFAKYIRENPKPTPQETKQHTKAK